MDADGSGVPPPRGPALADYLARFPCPLAAARESPAASWNVQGADSLVTALELVYESDARCQLTVKTVRSREGLDPRGLPFDTTADLLSNFLSRADVVADPEHASDPAARRERYQRIQHAAGHAPSRPATVSCDGAPATGQRIDALGLAVLELPWHDGATVLCVGVPELVDRLVLHTATAEDLSRF